MKGTSAGYYDDDTTIKVIDVPRLFITVTGSGKDGDIYLSPITVTVYNDNGLLVTGATVTFGTESKTTINGQVEFTVEHSEEKDYTITAKFQGFEDAASVIAKVKKTPGFELLTLIAAIGIAFILLRLIKK